MPIHKKHRFSENMKRSILKALTFRTVVVIINAVVVYQITKRHDLTIGVVVASNVINTILYFLHERVWNKVHWGKHPHP
jgi:uncharacterized membrane protein